MKQLLQNLKTGEGVVADVPAPAAQRGRVIVRAAASLISAGTERAACAGTGYAAHAELLSVPKNLCAPLPDGVDFESGAFSTLGAIALQGVRLAEPTLGESVVVIGLGLVGQLAAQLLKANGCRVFGIDLDESRIELARRLGMDDGCAANADVKEAVAKWTRGRGADAVLITAATSSDEPVELAGEV